MKRIQSIPNLKLRRAIIFTCFVLLLLFPAVGNTACNALRYNAAGILQSSHITLQGAINLAVAGDVIKLTGADTCDRVTIPAERSGITLDGGGTGLFGAGGAMITGTDPNNNIVLIQTATDVTITGFSLITGVGGGIAVNRASTATITNSTIAATGGVGIDVSEGATARIGFTNPDDPSSVKPVLVSSNTTGIRVGRGSSAWIVGNTVKDNTGNGITVFRVSEARVAGNTIDYNVNGVSIAGNSAVTLGGSGSSFLDQGNSTGTNNTSRGVRCDTNSSVEGKLAGLTGAGGQTVFLADCINNTIP